MLTFKAFEAGIRIAPNSAFSSDPLTGKVGQIYYNTTRLVLRICVDAAPVWQDLYIHRTTVDDSSLRWDVAADRYIANPDLRINSSSIYTPDGTTGTQLNLSSGASTDAGIDGANILITAGAGGSGAEQGHIVVDTPAIREIGSAAGLPLEVRAGDASDTGTYGGLLHLQGGIGVIATTGGLAEITEVLTVADVAGSLLETYWLLNSPNAGYYVWYNTNLPPVAQIFTIEPNTFDADLQSKYFLISSADLTDYYVWYNVTTTLKPEISDVQVTGTPAAGSSFTFKSANNDDYYVWYTVDAAGSDPASAAIGIQVDILSSDSVTDIANKTISAINLASINVSAGLQSTDIVRITDSTSGPVTTHIADVDTTFSFSVFQYGSLAGNGTDPAPGGTGIEVAILETDDIPTITTKTSAAIGLAGSFTTSVLGGPDRVQVTDDTAGLATSPSDIDTGFVIIVTQAGTDSATGSDPGLSVGALAGKTGIQVFYTQNDLVATIGNLTALAIDAFSDFGATDDGSGTVTVTNADVGEVTAASDGTAGVSINVTQNGIDALSVGGVGPVEITGRRVDIDATETLEATANYVSIESVTQIDLNAISIGIKAQSATDPLGGDEGDIYYNTTYKRFRKHNGISWTWWDINERISVINIVDIKDDTLTTLPTDTVTQADGQTIIDGDWVVFTNLTANADRIYEASVSGTSITWTQVVFGSNALGIPQHGEVIYPTGGTSNNDYLFIFDGTDWAIVGPRRGVTADNAIRWSGSEWVANESVNITDNAIYIKDGLASGDLTLQSGTDSLTQRGDISLEAGVATINLNAGKIHIGAQSTVAPPNSIAGDIYFDPDRQKIKFHDSFGYRDVDHAEITGEVTGFASRAFSVYSWDDLTRTFTIEPAPLETSFEYYIQGTRYVVDSAQSIQIPDTDGMHFIAFNGTILFVQSGSFTPDLLTDYAYVANVYWDSTNQKAVVVGDERHGLTMDGTTHSYLHSNLGYRWRDGLGAGNFSITGDGSSDAHAQLSFSEGSAQDEDIIHNITDTSDTSVPYGQILSTAAELPVYYKTGTGTQWRKDSTTAYPFKVVSGAPQYNYYNGGTSEWEVQPVPTGKFFVMWIFVNNDFREPVVSVMGQDYWDTQNDAEEQATYASMVFGDLPAQEMKAIYRLIFEYDSTYTSTIKTALRVINDVRQGIDVQLGSYTALGDHGQLSGLTDQDHPATAIFTDTNPFGGVMLTTAETDVQLSLERLDAKAMKINMINVEKYAADPTVVGASQIYYDTVNNLYKYYDGTQFRPIGGGELGNGDRNASLMGGGTIKWKASTDTLSWNKDAYLQIPGVPEARNKIAAGSVILPLDGDVAYVDVNRTGVTPATLTVTVINIASMSTVSPANEDRFIIARRHDGDVYWGLQDGQRISTTDGGVLVEVTLTDNTTGGLIFAENAADNDAIVVKYSLKRGTAVEVGHLYITNNGASAGISGSSNELTEVGLDFAAVINGANVELQYTTTNTGTDVEMRYVIEKWDAS